MLSKNFDIHARCSALGLTPLLVSLVKGKLEAANYLLGRGADEYLKSEEGLTVLSVAAISGDVASIEMLLKCGHNPNSRDGCDKTCCRDGKNSSFRISSFSHTVECCERPQRPTLLRIFPQVQLDVINISFHMNRRSSKFLLHL